MNNLLYKHPEKITTIMHEDYTKPFVPQRKVALSAIMTNIRHFFNTLSEGKHAIKSANESNIWASQVSDATATPRRVNLMFLYGIVASIQRSILPFQGVASSLEPPFAIHQ